MIVRYTTLGSIKSEVKKLKGIVLDQEDIDNEPLSFKDILENYDIQEAIWCLRVLPGCDIDVLKFKLKLARHVEQYDESSIAKKCLDVLEKFIKNEATKEELFSANKEIKYNNKNNLNHNNIVKYHTILAAENASSIENYSTLYTMTNCLQAFYIFNIINNGVSITDYLNFEKGINSCPLSIIKIVTAVINNTSEIDYQREVFKEIFCGENNDTMDT